MSVHSNSTNETLFVEFYGTARLSMEKPHCTIRRPEGDWTLGEALRDTEILMRRPGSLLRDGSIVNGLIVNLDGQKFTRTTNTKLDGVHSILIMSVDVGG